MGWQQDSYSRPARSVLNVGAILVIALLSISLAGKAVADDSPSNKSESKDLFIEGVRLISTEDYAGALTAFQDSYRLNPKPMVLFNIGMCKKALYNHSGALGDLESFIEISADDGHKYKELRKRAMDAIETLRRLVGWIVVDGGPPGAIISVGTEIQHTLPLTKTVYLAPGKYAVKVMNDEELLLETSVTVAAEAETVINIAEPITTVEADSRIDSAAGSDAQEDLTSLPPQAEVTINNIQFTNDSIKLSHKRKVWGIGLVSGGAGCVVVGLIFNIKGAADYKSAQRMNDLWLTTGDNEYWENYYHYKNTVLPVDRVVMTIGYALGGALSLTGAILLMKRKKEKEATAIAVHPSVNGVAITF